MPGFSALEAEIESDFGKLRHKVPYKFDPIILKVKEYYKKLRFESYRCTIKKKLTLPPKPAPAEIPEWLDAL